jgi:hypothetical protein
MQKKGRREEEEEEEEVPYISTTKQQTVSFSPPSPDDYLKNTNYHLVIIFSCPSREENPNHQNNHLPSSSHSG